MSHYRSNLLDLEFNLFYVHRLDHYLEKVSGFEVDTARDVLRQLEHLASGPWADALIESDRHPPVLCGDQVILPKAMRTALDLLRDGGWERLGLPEEMGGTPVPHLLFWATQELLLGANTPATFYAGGPLFARVLFEEGTEAQKTLARLAVERAFAGTMQLTESDAGSDVGAGTTRAIHVEGDTYHLEGVKRFITGGDHDGAENILHLVLARSVGAGPGTKGLSLFAVPKYLVDEDGRLGERNGIVPTRLEHKLGLNGSATCEMTLGAKRPCVGYLVGGRHEGIRQMFRVVEHARMTIGTKAAATLSTGYLNALQYARERVQGPDLAQAADKSAPRVAIIRHPDVRRMLMEQKAHAEGLRALWTYTAWVRDQGDLLSDPGLAARAGLLLPLVKGYSSEKAYELLALSLQVLGGSGYTDDYPIGQYLRDAKIDSIYEGTTGIQALDLFFRQIVRDQGQAVAALASEVADFVKAGSADDPIAAEREELGRLLDDTQAHLGVAVSYLMASRQEAEQIYRAGLHLNGLLESMAETVIAWQLLEHAAVALRLLEERPDDGFLIGKVASARFFVRHVAPKAGARRAAVEVEDGALMAMPDTAW
jgi:alkylation response protein AidB-like acyl-CoA dehydrogenase